MSTALSLTSMYVRSLFSILLYFPRYGPDRHLLLKKWLWEDNPIYKLGLLFWCTALSLTSIYLKTSFISISWVLKISQDMARTSIHYEKWLREDNSIHIHGRIMVLGFRPSPHCHLYINQVSFKCQQ